ncbi:carboxylesterase/lipase family protein [Nocardia terpenica]|uniref:Carboxylic ester hydrolase n=1 Tax=Nocardia terpenica TaxID=455432 RepID=A0A6G9Z426_9NOCA|nr:carboxylesterase family protein [Nocardia terpenica]QIS20190.1 carboxylesterase family protein [Nocardia terpenica]
MIIRQASTPRRAGTRGWVRAAAALTAVAGLTACATPAPAPPHPIVQTGDGPVRGTAADGYRTFRNIPYAAPPVGGLRWAPPVPPAPWTAVRDATAPGHACPQNASMLGDPASDTEDCLSLNITEPDHAPGQTLPVMVWIHGGGFYFGSGDTYRARRLATRGHVVVVTLNYRLGALGYLAHPALDTRDTDSGNYGLLDQQAALRWVHRDIGRFGGNPGAVTVFGESAGATSTCALLAAPAAAGLFQRAIVQSSPCTETNQWPYPDGYWFARPRADAEQQGRALAEDLGCGQNPDIAACLRAVPAARILAAADGAGYGPAYGGRHTPLPVAPAEAITTGAIAPVPVIHGTTRDEHATFVWAIETMTGHRTTTEDYRRQLDSFFGADADRVAARYPLTDYGSPSRALAALFTDYTWACTAGATDDALTAHTPVYAYEFADPHPPWGTDMPPASFPTGALHVGEIPSLFDDPEFPAPLTAAQTRLSDTMIGYWTRFARTGDPNGDHAPPWPRYQQPTDVLSLSPTAIHPTDLATEHHCPFWSTVHH